MLKYFLLFNIKQNFDSVLIACSFVTCKSYLYKTANFVTTFLCVNFFVFLRTGSDPVTMDSPEPGLDFLAINFIFVPYLFFTHQFQPTIIDFTINNQLRQLW